MSDTGSGCFSHGRHVASSWTKQCLGSPIDPLDYHQYESSPVAYFLGGDFEDYAALYSGVFHDHPEVNYSEIWEGSLS